MITLEQAEQESMVPITTQDELTRSLLRMDGISALAKQAMTEIDGTCRHACDRAFTTLTQLQLNQDALALFGHPTVEEVALVKALRPQYLAQMEKLLAEACVVIAKLMQD